MSEEDEQPTEGTEDEAAAPEAAAEEEAAAPEGGEADSDAPQEADADSEDEAAASEAAGETEALAEETGPPAEAAAATAADAPEADAGVEADDSDSEAKAKATEVADEAEAEASEAADDSEAKVEEAAPPRRKQPAAEEKAKEVVPGADLDPIAITEERELTAEERAALEAEEEERAAREAAEADQDEDEIPARKVAAVPKDTSIQATGKRKSSVARVLLRAGDGKFEINGREIGDYLPRAAHQTMARQPLVASGYEGNVNLQIRVHGGGISGQAGAIRHGISRALVELEPELRGELKKRGLLTRDAREKERRKAGLKKARKKPQFSKR